MFFAVEEVSWIVSDISTAANHSRDHRATRRISSTFTLQRSARTQPITIDNNQCLSTFSTHLLVLWQDNIHPNLCFVVISDRFVCLFLAFGIVCDVYDWTPIWLSIWWNNPTQPNENNYGVTHYHRSMRYPTIHPSTLQSYHLCVAS